MPLDLSFDRDMGRPHPCRWCRRRWSEHRHPDMACVTFKGGWSEHHRYEPSPRSLRDAERQAAKRAGMARQRVQLKAIVALVSLRFEISERTLRGKCRSQPIVHARSIAMWLAYRHARMSYPAIGHYFGGRDHSTVMHAVSEVSRKRLLDDDMWSDVRELEQQVEEQLAREVDRQREQATREVRDAVR